LSLKQILTSSGLRRPQRLCLPLWGGGSFFSDRHHRPLRRYRL
jgi:hypothetical protein